jgi:hypothetical protein
MIDQFLSVNTEFAGSIITLRAKQLNVGAKLLQKFQNDFEFV